MVSKNGIPCVLHCTALHCMILHCIILYYTVRVTAPLHTIFTILYSHSTASYCTPMFLMVPTMYVYLLLKPSSSTNDHMNEDMIELQSTDTYATTQNLIELEPFAETDNFPVFPSAPTHTPTMESNLIETSSPPLYSAPTQQQPSAQVMSGISISVPPPSQTQSALSAQHFDSLYGHGEEVRNVTIIHYNIHIDVYVTIWCRLFHRRKTTVAKACIPHFRHCWRYPMEVK